MAATEDDVAYTYDQLALTRPRDAARLRAYAEHARHYAQTERDRAVEYSTDPA